MTLIKFSFLSVPLAALALTGLVATAAVAETKADASKPAAETGKSVHKDSEKDGKRGFNKDGKRRGMMLSAEELDKLEAMTPEQRGSYFKERRSEFDKLSKEERKAKMDERQKAFDSLSDSDKKALVERNNKFREKTRAEHKAQMEDFVKSLTPEQRAKWDALGMGKKGHGENRPGRKGDKPPHDDEGGPDASDKAE
ncbi:MAG TPA: hypothetical protein VEF76_00285 [Patescibacteria group bacterium]|nr:hypothetical protein [Patescibacteria group bacterium]